MAISIGIGIRYQNSEPFQFFKDRVLRTEDVSHRLEMNIMMTFTTFHVMLQIFWIAHRSFVRYFVYNSGKEKYQYAWLLIRLQTTCTDTSRRHVTSHPLATSYLSTVCFAWRKSEQYWSCTNNLRVAGYIFMSPLTLGELDFATVENK